MRCKRPVTASRYHCGHGVPCMIAYSGEPEPAVDVMVEFRFLGTFAVRCGGSWHPGPPPKKGREPLQYLGTYPRRVATRDELAAAFWPGIDIDAVVHRLHLAASGARAYLRNLSGGSDALQCVGG